MVPNTARMLRRRDSLSSAEARRLALAAQGFAAPRAAAPPSLRAVVATVRRLGVVQIDSVNVVVRSHYLPLFSRLGSYDRALLERAAYGGRGRSLFEYWGHEASFLPVGTQPLLRWRMREAREGLGTWGRIARIAQERPALLDDVHAQVRERGPLAAGEIEGDHHRGEGGWWGWSEVKVVLEYLFWSGVVTTATRRNFERRYDLTERVLPHAVLAAPTPDDATAHRELLRTAARALGVAAATDLRDYFRLPASSTPARIAELVESGALLPVTVEGWRGTAYLDAGARIPRRVDARALLSPFDSLIWERARTDRLFDFHYRIEIYTPAHKRVHGYYVLPFLFGDRLVARVDLKAERDRATLRVQAVHYEPGCRTTEIRDALRAELAALAAWLGLDRVALPR